MTDIAQKILNLIISNAYITTYEMSKLANMSRRSVVRILKELRDNKIIEREGSFKSGYWKIL